MPCYQNLLGIFPNFFDFKLNCAYITGAFKSAVGVDADVLAGPVPVVGHALINVVAVRARRRVALGTNT